MSKLRQAILPTWSPKGDRLAFQSDARGGRFEIYSIALDGSGLRRETHSAIDTIDPAWSPGRPIDCAFSAAKARSVPVDRQGNAKKLTSGGNDASPAWRPTG